MVLSLENKLNKERLHLYTCLSFIALALVTSKWIRKCQTLIAWNCQLTPPLVCSNNFDSSEDSWASQKYPGYSITSSIEIDVVIRGHAELDKSTLCSSVQHKGTAFNSTFPLTSAIVELFPLTITISKCYGSFRHQVRLRSRGRTSCHTLIHSQRGQTTKRTSRCWIGRITHDQETMDINLKMTKMDGKIIKSLVSENHREVLMLMIVLLIGNKQGCSGFLEYKLGK